MTLGDQEDPVVEVKEEGCKAKREGWFEDDKVMTNMSDGVNGHMSCDRACTQIGVTQLILVCRQRSNRPSSGTAKDG